MVGPVIRFRAKVRFRCMGRFTGLVQFSVELGGGCDMRVCARLCLRFSIMWTDTKKKVRSP